MLTRSWPLPLLILLIKSAEAFRRLAWGLPLACELPPGTQRGVTGSNENATNRVKNRVRFIEDSRIFKAGDGHREFYFCERYRINRCHSKPRVGFNGTGRQIVINSLNRRK